MLFNKQNSILYELLCNDFFFLHIVAFLERLLQCLYNLYKNIYGNYKKGLASFRQS